MTRVSGKVWPGNRSCIHLLAVTLLLCALSSSCRTAQPEVFEPTINPVSERILPLQLHIVDLDSENPGIGSRRRAESKYVILKDFDRNVFGPGEREFGHAVIRVGRRVSVNYGWFLLSLSTLFTANLLGVPAASQTWHIDLDFQVLDAKLNKLEHFSASGENTQYYAMYWGRVTPLGTGEGTAYAAGEQMACALAVVEALDELKRVIGRSGEAINSRLRKVGPIRAVTLAH